MTDWPKYARTALDLSARRDRQSRAVCIGLALASGHRKRAWRRALYRWYAADFDQLMLKNLTWSCGLPCGSRGRTLRHYLEIR